VTNLITDAEVELKTEVERGIALKGLLANNNWKLVIDEGFLDAYLKNATRDMISSDDDARRMAKEKIQAVEYFKLYLITTLNIASDAEERIGA
jgi:adenylate cyclase class IV